MGTCVRLRVVYRVLLGVDTLARVQYRVQHSAACAMEKRAMFATLRPFFCCWDGLG